MTSTTSTSCKLQNANFDFVLFFIVEQPDMRKIGLNSKEKRRWQETKFVVNLFNLNHFQSQNSTSLWSKYIWIRIVCIPPTSKPWKAKTDDLRKSASSAKKPKSSLCLLAPPVKRISFVFLLSSQPSSLPNKRRGTLKLFRIYLWSITW